MLVRQGERVRYVSDAIVRSPMPKTFGQLKTQDRHWEAASTDAANRRVAADLLAASRARDPVRLDALLEYLASPLLALWSLLALVAVGVLGSAFGVAVSVAPLCGLGLYVRTVHMSEGRQPRGQLG